MRSPSSFFKPFHWHVHATNADEFAGFVSAPLSLAWAAISWFMLARIRPAICQWAELWLWILCSYFTNTSQVSGAKVNAAPVMPNKVVMKTQLWGIVTSVSGGEPTVAA